MQSPQPKIRAVGISILSTITTCSSQHQSILALAPQFHALASDDWWEVQAQLVLLCAHLLSKIAGADRQDIHGTESVADEHESSVTGAESVAPSSPGNQAPVADGGGAQDMEEQLL